MQEIDVNIEQSLDHEINGEIMKEYGTFDYNELENKPSINGVELVGNKTSADLGIEINAFDVVTKEDLEQGLDLKQDKGDYIVREELTQSLDGKQDKGDYALKDEIPSVPTKLSELDNDSGYITEDELNTAIGDINTILDNINGEVV